MLMESHGASRWSARITLDPARIQQLFSQWTKKKKAAPTIDSAPMQPAAAAAAVPLVVGGEERAEADIPDEDDDIEESDPAQEESGPAQDKQVHRRSRRGSAATSAHDDSAVGLDADVPAATGHRSSSRARRPSAAALRVQEAAVDAELDGVCSDEED